MSEVIKSALSDFDKREIVASLVEGVEQELVLLEIVRRPDFPRREVYERIRRVLRQMDVLDAPNLELKYE